MRHSSMGGVITYFFYEPGMSEKKTLEILGLDFLFANEVLLILDNFLSNMNKFKTLRMFKSGRIEEIEDSTCMFI